jgi:Glycosyltransferase WbsX
MLALACGLAPASAGAAIASSAQVGAYYFDGWAGPFSGFHFTGLRGGPFEERRPLFGWSDRPRGTMPRQLAWAADAGLDFLVFDWYWHARATAYPYLNRGFENYRAIPPAHRSGVGFAIDYINGGASDEQQREGFPDAPVPPPAASFVVPRARWDDQVRRWSRAFRDPGYLRIGGRPLFVIHDAGSFLSQWGGIAGANAAVADLHRAGAFVAAGVGDATGLAGLTGLRVDALTQYNYPLAIPPRSGRRPWGELATAARRLWREIAAGPLPLIPSATSGWDPRPWREYQAGHLFWFDRTPARVAALLSAAIGVARAERIPGPPLALVASWNELGEGHYILPTIGHRFSYLRALAAALGAGGSRP